MLNHFFSFSRTNKTKFRCDSIVWTLHQRWSSDSPSFYHLTPESTATISCREAATPIMANNATQEPWSPSSWRSKPIKQAAVYSSQAAVDASLAQLRSLPPIVTPTEITKLKASLRDVALGKAFLLQGGDCAELFSYCSSDAIESKMKLLLQMSLVLIWGANKPVVRIVRGAGQYAKPRSSPTEIVDGVEMPSFRGDILNGNGVHERDLDPARLVRFVVQPSALVSFCLSPSTFSLTSHQCLLSLGQHFELHSCLALLRNSRSTSTPRLGPGICPRPRAAISIRRHRRIHHFVVALHANCWCRHRRAAPNR